MIDETSDNQIDETFDKIKIDYGLVVIENPRHPEYSEDKVFVGENIIAVMDGVGSGGKSSANAAETVQRKLKDVSEKNPKDQSFLQAEEILKEAILQASNHIKHIQRITENTNIDTTLCMGMVCRSLDGQKRVLLTANVGDSRIYKYVPETGFVEQVTTDHSLVQEFINHDIITHEQAFNHPKRNVITKAVGQLGSSKDIDFKVVDINEGDIFLAVSDGVSDNIKPEDLAQIIASEYSASSNQSSGGADLEGFTSGIAKRAIANMSNPNLEYAKKDDVSVAALGVFSL